MSETVFKTGISVPIPQSWLDEGCLFCGERVDTGVGAVFSVGCGYVTHGPTHQFCPKDDA